MWILSVWLVKPTKFLNLASQPGSRHMYFFGITVSGLWQILCIWCLFKEHRYLNNFPQSKHLWGQWSVSGLWQILCIWCLFKERRWVNNIPQSKHLWGPWSVLVLKQILRDRCFVKFDRLLNICSQSEHNELIYNFNI